jgi:DNA adenine methylase
MALFRYPGGKTHYTKFILPALYQHKAFSTFVEPFTGGGSVALAIAARYPGVKLILNDLDSGVWAFWDLIANAPDSEFRELKDRIANTRPTLGMFHEMKASHPADRLGLGFRMFFLNRTSYGGMGVNPMGGKNQDKSAVRNRWRKPEKLMVELDEARRLLAGRTTMGNKHFREVIPLAGRDSLMFLDPPYYEAGNQLYKFPWTDADHVELRDALLGKSDWVMSYDDAPRIRELYQTLAYIMTVKYSLGAKRNKMTELLLTPRLEFPTQFNPDVGVGG